MIDQTQAPAGQQRVIVIGPGEGEDLSSGTSVRHVKLDIDGLQVTEFTVQGAPMGGLHTHERHADAFYVLEGELDVAISATETVRLGPGSFAVAPPGVVHAFGVPDRARFLNIHAPGVNFAGYLRAIVDLHRKGEQPGAELFERFDIHMVQ
jgi:quercetin dioxygenase-like cupin family protein